STTSPVVPNSYAAYTLGRKCQIPDPPTLLFDTLAAYQYMPINLILAVDTLPGLTYKYYTNPDKTGPLSSSVVTFNPPKDDYYVTASNGTCESEPTQIILKDPCPEYLEDAEGHNYKVVSLMGRCWTENLRTTLNPVTDEQILFANPYTCTGCAAQLDTIFGLLYTWYSAVGAVHTTPPQGICPNGWHIPSQAEWHLLEHYSTAQLMSMNYWLNPPGGGTDDFEFTALPAGWYNGAIERYQDLYGFAGWWASDAPTETAANYFSMNYYCNTLQQGEMKKSNGLSVRCVMD
ncbi:MAG: fibrobacter succinogenes major paralogous domain-containing protein, partial [Lentimicrobiaceae bacterium]|nr:fibrobacter succinogenes major paralogous domain-containing protein [Lentimicrobiaceae bacterium]